MIPFIINDDVRMEILRVKRNAENNPVPLEVVEKSASAGEGAPGGDDPRFIMLVPTAFKVVYTHEIQPGDVICRHLSISINEPDRMPNLHAVEMIAGEFGFVNKKININKPGCIDEPDHLLWWLEKIGEDCLPAVNIVEPLDGNYNRLRKKT